MRRNLIQTAGIALSLGCVLLLNADAAYAQFSGPVAPPNLPIPTQSGIGQLPSNVRDPQVQKLLLLRALQQRAGSGGGVKTGVPQFIPFGNNFMPNAMMQQQTTPAATGAATDSPTAEGKSVAEKKADYQAAREERKRKTRERAEKRKAEAAARAKDKAAAGVPADPA